MAKITIRALSNISYNPEFFPEKNGELWAKVGDVVQVPSFYEDRPDLVDIWVKLGHVEIVEPPKVYVPKNKSASADNKESE